jgi:hypothetical protein
METEIIYSIMGALMVYVMYLVFRGRDVGIADPTLGFLNLGGDAFASLVDEDRSALSPLFSKTECGTGLQIPKCDVLFVYADLASDGSVGLGREVTIRHLAERAGASIAIVASNNSAEHGIAASKTPGPKRTNLVWTFDRKGEAFARFFKELFTQMKDGTPMPAAWVAISPQYKSKVHLDLPETVCQMEAGQVRFR